LQVDHFDAITVNCDWRRLDPKLYNLPLNIKVIDLKTYEFSYEINNKKQTFILEFGKNHEDLDFTIQVDLSPQVDETWLKTVMDQNFRIVVHPTNWLINKYSRSLAIENTEYTSILTLTLRDELASRAKMFLDTLASEYILFTLENQITINRNTEKFIDKQLEEVTRILDSLEYSINKYKQSQDIIDLPREQTQAFDQLGKFDLDLKTLEMREQTMKELEEFLFKEYNNPVIPPMAYLGPEDALLKNLIMQLFESKVKRSELLVDYKESDGRINRVDSTIKTIRNNIYRYTQDSRKSIQGQMAEVKRQIIEIEALLRELPFSERELLGMERKLTVNEGHYSF
jgi:uncharacterized protein involved in exopolysaccharide biosynthesis